ncbi:MAG: DUF3501 family protein [Candidatus Pacebacteria bacterium]|nr:DUF3501 family protein [Candidatus Paceibacterota bacterium]
MPSPKQITAADIMPLSEYVKIRDAKRKEIVAMKQNRRLEVGPHVSFYFENWQTMWLQIQEMLYIEKGGHDQLVDELEAYNPLIPQGRELVATVMFEIDDPQVRKKTLGQLGGVEETIFLAIGNHKIMAKPETDIDRTTAEGKTSSVHFVHFGLTAEQVAAFKTEASVVLGFDHPLYGHSTRLPTAVRDALARDFY